MGEGAAHDRHAPRKRDPLARTGLLLALLVPIFLVYGLATLAGYLTDTGVLIIALVMLVLATFVVIGAVLRIADVPPEDDDASEFLVG